MVALTGRARHLAVAALDRPIRATILLTTLVISFLWLVFRPAFFVAASDFVTLAPDYAPQVRSLVEGEGFGSWRYPPVFPLILAGLDLLSSSTGLHSGWLGAGLLMALAISGSVLIYQLGQRLWGPRRGLLCVVVWLAYPVCWPLWLQPLSTAPFVVVLLAAVLLMLHSAETGSGGASGLWLTGAMLGLAMLIRSSGLGLPIVFALFVLIRLRYLSWSRRCLSAGLLIGGALLVVLPWEVQAWRATGQVLPLSTGGVPTVLDGLTYAVDPSENRPVWAPDDVRRLQWEIHEKSYRELDSESSIAGFLLEKLRTTPGAVIQLFAIKGARASYGTDSGVLDEWLLVFQIPVVTLLLFGTALTWRHSGPPHEAAILTVMIVLYFWLMTTVVLSIVRYMVPALALMVVTLPALGRSSGGRSLPHPMKAEDVSRC